MPGCASEEISLKSFFLGPQAENGDWFQIEINEIVGHYVKWRRSLFPSDGEAISPSDRVMPEFRERQHLFRAKLRYLLSVLEAETPKFTPRYMGHMVSEVSLPALLGHFVTLLHNPNNASKEVSKMTTLIEKEAIEGLANMVGYPSRARGHFTSGGTVANFEALWRARNRIDWQLAQHAALAAKGEWSLGLIEAAHRPCERRLAWEEVAPFSMIHSNPIAAARKISRAFQTEYRGPVVLVSGNKHYSWEKAANLLGLGDEAFWSIPLDRHGKMKLAALKQMIERAREQVRPIAAIVSVAGTTEMGVFDPVNLIQDHLDELFEKDNLIFWHHADAAYGGYYCCLSQEEAGKLLGPSTAHSLLALSRTTSLTIDPHKLGYVPYSCGAFLARGEDEYRVSAFSAPYLESGKARGTWASTLEGSRPGSGAVATWLTAECIGLNHHGYGKILEKGILARQQLEGSLRKVIPEVRVAGPSSANVLCFTMAATGAPLSQANQSARKVFKTLRDGESFAVSRTSLSLDSYREMIEEIVNEWGGKVDCGEMELVRTVSMNPFTTSRNMAISIADEFAKAVAAANRSPE